MRCLVVNELSVYGDRSITGYCLSFEFIGVILRICQFHFVFSSVTLTEVDEVCHRHFTWCSGFSSPVVSNHVAVINTVDYLFVSQWEAFGQCVRNFFRHWYIHGSYHVACCSCQSQCTIVSFIIFVACPVVDSRLSVNLSYLTEICGDICQISSTEENIVFCVYKVCIEYMCVIINLVCCPSSFGCVNLSQGNRNQCRLCFCNVGWV